MRLSQSLLAGVAIIAILAIVAAVVARVLNVVELARAPAVAEKVLAQGEKQGEDAQGKDRVVVLSPEPASRWSRFWLGDPWNRDPVCGGDPLCRDAYFRDWPYARRPSYPHPAPPHPAPATQPITITNTATSNVYAPPPTASTPTSSSLPPPPPQSDSSPLPDSMQMNSQITSQANLNSGSQSEQTAPQPVSQSTPAQAQTSSPSMSQSVVGEGADAMPLTEDTAGSPLRAASCTSCARRKKAMDGLLRR
jgi:hypothetical protein